MPLRSKATLIATLIGAACTFSPLCAASDKGGWAIAGISGAGALATGGAAMPVAGAAEVVGFLFCFFADPADIPNAGTPVDINDYLGFKFPQLSSIDPTIPAPVVDAASAFTQVLDGGLAYTRAYAESVDRFQGALLSGDAAAASQRAAEANTFAAIANELMHAAPLLFHSFVSIAGQAGMLGNLNAVVTTDDVVDILELHAAGGVPSFESIAIQSYGVTSLELTHISQSATSVLASGLTNSFSSIAPGFSTTIPAGTLMTSGFSTGCETCSLSAIPEPTTFWMLSAGIAMLAWALRRKLSRSTHRAPAQDSGVRRSA
jgi:hypothetical protein